MKLIERSDWTAALTSWFMARLVLCAAWLVAMTLEDRFDNRSQLNNGLVAWDGTWNRLIAIQGYRPGGEEVRFSPLLPFLGRITGSVFGDRPTIGLVLVANLAAVVAGAGVAAYTRQVTGNDRRAGFMAAAATALWPASFVLGFGYGESLLIAFSALAALAARRDAWWLAAALAAGAGLVRPTGIALGLLLAVIWWTSDRPRRGVVAVGAPAVGLSLHLLTSRLAGDTWLAPVQRQSPYRGELVDPFSRLLRGFADLLGDERWGDGLHLPFAILAIALVALVFAKVGFGEGLLSLVVVLVALSADNWNSLERYVANAFPVFVAIGIALSGRRWAPLVLGASAFTMGALTVMAWSGRYVP